MAWYMKSGTDVVGYTYLSDVHCPRCTLGLIGTVATLPPSPEVLESEIRSFGTEVRDLADPEDPRWRDSGTVPLPIFQSDDLADDDGNPYRCAGCREVLGD